MAILITSGPVPDGQKNSEITQGSTFDEYSRSRKQLPLDEEAIRSIYKGKEAFKKSVIDHLAPSAPHIRIGEYFVFQVSELKKLIEGSPEADHIRFHNSIDEQHYHRLFAVPALSTAGSKNKEIISHTSVVLDGIPCPPDPRCPK